MMDFTKHIDQLIDIQKSMISFMIENYNFQKIYVKKLDVEDFTESTCIKCFELMSQYSLGNLHFDVSAAIGKHGLSDVLGFDSIRLQNGSNYHDTWFEILRQQGARRKINMIAHQLYQKTFEDSSVFDLIMESSQNLNEVSQALIKNKVKSKMNQVSEYKEMIKKAYESEGVIGLSIFGDNGINRMINGAEEGDSITLAGRPSMGKTAHAVQIFGECIKQDIPALFYSLEMMDTQLLQRLDAYLTNNNYAELRDGKVQDEMQQDSFLNSYVKSNCRIVEKSMNWQELEADVLATHNSTESGVKVVIIDYLQLLKSEKNGKRLTDYEAITEAARGCKNLAKAINGTVISLSQLNRQVETRGGFKIPQTSDLKQSGAIEENSDKILMYYRPSFYGYEANDVYTHDDNWNEYKGNDRIIVPKNRGGETGGVYGWFNFMNMEFTDELPDELARKRNSQDFTPMAEINRDLNPFD